mgnify:CR=1 FL=1
MSKKNYRHVRRATVVRQPDGHKIKLGGYRPEKRSSEDKTYASTDQELPPHVDLRPYMTPVENQGNSNSCTANAMAGAYEYLANRLRGTAEDVSRLFIYYNARDLDGDTSQDEGTYLKSCVKVLRQYGACLERTWAFDIERIYDEPGEEAYEEAANFLIEDAYRLKVDLDAMRSCLAEGYPFSFGLQLFSSFQKAGANGLVPMPDPDREQHDGGHAMLCVGYSDADKVFIVRNSWGEEWGDRGYCYIPYAYMTHPELNGDLWTIRQVSGTDIDLSQGIQGGFDSLFDTAMAAIATAIQVPGATEGPGGIAVSDDGYEVEYEELLVYMDNQGFVSIDELDDLEALYQLDSDLDFMETEDSFEESEEEYSEEEYSDEEESEASYDEEESEEEDEYSDEEESEEEYEDEEDEEEEEYEDEEDEEEEYEEEEGYEEEEEEEYEDEEESGEEYSEE